MNSLGRLLSGCVAVILGVSLIGCTSSPSQEGVSGTTTTGTSGGGGNGGGAGQGGGQGGSGGAGGAGGAPTSPGHSTNEWVAAGGVGKSEAYIMVFTVGQPTINQQKSMSSGYRLQGGLVAASGSMK